MCREPPTVRSLADRFSEICASGATPDLFQFLKENPPRSEDGTVGVLLVDLRHHWRSGKERLVETYLSKLSEPPLSPEAVVQLVVNEFRLRREAGLLPTVSQFLDRFPHLAERLTDALRDCDAAPTAQSELNDTPAATPAPLVAGSIPQAIGRYKVSKLLGRGGFGNVHLAYDDDLKRHVAIKVPNRERLSSQRQIDSYLREAQILASLDHPNIVPVYDFGRTEDGTCFTVCKLIEGSDLSAQLKKDRPTPQRAAEIIMMVANALHHAHKSGLVHRDIKPANLLLDAEGTPYVTDFGLALKDSEAGIGQGFAGTIPYMSPEQARGEGHLVDARSDVYSLGVVLYELLTGKRPSEGSGTLELLEAIKSREPRPPRQLNDALPVELDRICLKALAKEQRERYSTAQDLAEDLQAWLAGTASGDSSLQTGPLPKKQIAASLTLGGMGCSASVVVATLLMFVSTLGIALKSREPEPRLPDSLFAASGGVSRVGVDREGRPHHNSLKFQLTGDPKTPDPKGMYIRLKTQQDAVFNKSTTKSKMPRYHVEVASPGANVRTIDPKTFRFEPGMRFRLVVESKYNLVAKLSLSKGKKVLVRADAHISANVETTIPKVGLLTIPEGVAAGDYTIQLDARILHRTESTSTPEM